MRDQIQGGLMIQRISGLIKVWLVVALAIALSAGGVWSQESFVYFSKHFSPDTIGPGSVTTLVFEIGNESDEGVRGIRFVDKLPAGMVIASPANVSSDCGGILSAPAGGNQISLEDGSVAGSGFCTISVDVTSSVVGTHTNTTSDLISDAGNSGPASAELSVVAELPGFSKSFLPDRVGLGGRSRLTFTIDNSLNEIPRTDLAFSDSLPVGMIVADPANASSDCGGIVTALPGSNTISLTTDFLNPPMVGAFESCTVSVDVVGTAVGLLHNTSGELMSALRQGAAAESSGRASASLEVTADKIIISKRFVDDPTPPGGVVELEFQITNRSRDEFASDISFVDELDAVLPGLVSISPAQRDICGDGSVLEGDSVLKFSGGVLAPGASCRFSVALRVPTSVKAGSYVNATSPIEADLGGRTVEGAPATDSLFVSPVPIFAKGFVDDPVTPGRDVTLEFTVGNTSLTSELTQITFIDELPPEISSVLKLPEDGFCGPGSTMIFTPGSDFDPARLTVTGGGLAPGETCVFSVILEVAIGAGTGAVVNTTGSLTGLIDDVMVTAPPASDELRIFAGPQLTKSFIDDPVLPGGIARLRFTLTHSAEAPDAATKIQFTDDLNAVLEGMTAVGLPRADICGDGSVVRGTSVITFEGGVLKPGETCSFDVPVLVPEKAPLGTVTNTTSQVLSQVGNQELTSAPAIAELLVTTLSLTKRFLSDPVIPGEITGLEFTITNGGPFPATEIVFIDDLSRVLPGLESISGSLQDICGKGSQISGTSTLIFQGGTLAGQSSCTFRVQVLVPGNSSDGSYINATSSPSATIGGVNVTIPVASAILNVNRTLLSIEKAFLDNPVVAGDVVGLQFTITNLDPTRPAFDIAFSDPLPSGLSGVGGVQADICGAGSSISGTTTLNFTGGSLEGGESCTFSVPIQVPGELSGTIDNLTGELSGLVNKQPVRGEAASTQLIVILPPPDGISIRRRQLRPDGSFYMEWRALRGFVYCVETSINLEEEGWSQLGPEYFGVGDFVEFIDPEPEGPVRFYRVILKRRYEP